MDLDDIFDQAHGNGATTSSSSGVDPLDSIFDQAHGNVSSPSPDEGLSFSEGAQQVGSAVTRNLLSTPGFLYDVAKMMVFGPDASLQGRSEKEPEKAGVVLNSNPLGATLATEEALDSVLPERDPRYRYFTMPAEFATPSAAAKTGAKTLLRKGVQGATKTLAKKADDVITPGLIGVDAIAGVGAQAAEDITGDNTIAPIVGAIGAGSAAATAGSLNRSRRSIFSSATEDDIERRAGKVLRDVSGEQPAALVEKLDDYSATLRPSKMTSQDVALGTSSPSESYTSIKAPSGDALARNSSPSSEYIPSNDLGSILSDDVFIGQYNNTTKELPRLESVLKKAAPTKKVKTRPKDKETAAKKILRKRSEKPHYNAESLSDLVGGRIFVDSKTEIPAITRKIDGEMSILPDSVENYFEKPLPTGYEGYQFNVDLGGGRKGEVQLHTKESYDIAETIRPLYDRFRDDYPFSIDVAEASNRLAQRVKGGELPSSKEIQDVGDGIQNLFESEVKLKRFRTAAEVTQDPGLAALELELGARPESGYGKRGDRRALARDEVLDSQSKVEAVPDDFGQNLKDAATREKSSLDDDAKALWDDFPRNTEIDTLEGAAAVDKIIARQQAGRPLQSSVRDLSDQFIETATGGPTPATSGALQDLRSDALSELRNNQRLKPREREILTEIANQVEDSLNRQLAGTDAQNYRSARDATKFIAETYGQGTSGGALTGSKLLPENAAKATFGSERAVSQTLDAVGNDPALKEQWKRAIIEEIPRGGQDRKLTTAQFRKWLKGNKTGWKKLYGEESYKAAEKVVEDLQSEASLQKLSQYASRGQSATQQKQTVAGVVEDLFKGATRTRNSLITDAIASVAEMIGGKEEERLRKLLMKAVMEDPALTARLIQKPDPTRVSSTFQALSDLAERTGAAGVRGAALGARATSDEDSSSPLRREERSVESSSVTQNQESPEQTPSVFSPPSEDRSVFYQPTSFGDSSQRSVFDRDVTGEGTITRGERYGNVISRTGLDLIKQFEGLELSPYDDGTGVKTIGYGHTGSATKKGKISEQEAEALLEEDVIEAERAISDLVDVPISQEQYDALVSFTFNLGRGNLKRSTLLRKLNSEDYQGAAAEFTKWVNAGGKKMKGLERRRMAERDLFLVGLEGGVLA